MKITPHDVARVAGLARLRIVPEEMEPMAEQLSSILAYFEKLQQLDTADVPPSTHAVSIRNAFRDDVCTPSLPTDAALHNAPDAAQSCFKVPKIIET